MGVYIPNMSKPKNCMDCIVEEYADCDICKGMISASKYADRRYEHCPLIEIDLERDIPTIWYNRQTGQYEPKGTKQEVYEWLYKLKNGERRADEHNFERD